MIEKPRLAAQPTGPSKPQDFHFDIEAALRSVVSLQCVIPEDAFTAEILGTHRAGSGVVIAASGLVLTIGYLVTEAETVWMSSQDGRVTPGHPLAYDQESGFGLIQALGDLDLPALELGQSSAAEAGDPVLVAGGGGRKHCVFARIVGKDEFAGYWEYLLDEAIFTAPAHPLWGGAGLIGRDGKLLGIGSLHAQQASSSRGQQDVNMIVPIDLLKPILGDLVKRGRVNKPPRPWLGLYSVFNGAGIIVAGLSETGPAAEAGLRQGDVIHAVGDATIDDLADFYRKIWAAGAAGVEIPLQIEREKRLIRVRVKTADRASLLKRPQLH
jgi:S1-C subfamily serine protease